MAKCLKCGKENNEGAKFCRFCGNKMEVISGQNDKKQCPDCMKFVNSTAKFCNYCGYKFLENNTATSAGDISIDKNYNYVVWNVLPGQLAVKMDSNDLDSYGKIDGVLVAQGVKALLFLDGRFFDVLESGKYSFKDIEKTSEPGKKKGFWVKIKGFFKKLANNNIDKTDYTIVLIREVKFPLVFELNNVSTSSIRTNISLQLICQVSNMNEFFNTLLIDRKFVCYESLSNLYFPIVNNVLNQVLSKVNISEIDYNDELKSKVLNELKVKFGVLYNFISIVNIVSLSSKQEDIEKIRGLKEELYVSELELEQLQVRNDFMNKLQNEDNRNALMQARTNADFEAELEKIDEQRLITEDNKDKFILLMQAEKELREANTQETVQLGLDKIEKSRLFSESELELLELDLKNRKDEKRLDYDYSIASHALRNNIELDKKKLEWEIEVGTRRIENEINRQRMTDSYSDERKEKELDYRYKESEFEHDEALKQMELLKQAQAIKEEHEDNAHKREMELKQLEKERELEKLKLQTNMSFEQIMASNPDISPAAAQALAEKFKAEAQVSQNDKTIELVKQHEDDLKEILKQQMEMTNRALNNSKTLEQERLADKQAELDRVYKDAQHNQDNVLKGVEASLHAFAGVKANSQKNNKKFVKICPNCGKEVSEDSMVCDECGQVL